MKNTLLLILLFVGICNNFYAQSIQSNSKNFIGSSQFRNNGGAFTYELTVSAKAKRIESSPGSVILFPQASQMKITSFSFKGIDASSLNTVTLPVIVDANWLEFIDLEVSFQYNGNNFNSQLNGSSQTTIQNWSNAMKQLKLDCDPTFNYSCIPSANDFKNIRLVLKNASIPNETYSRFDETDNIIDAINKQIIAQNQASKNNTWQAENSSNSNYANQTSTNNNQNNTNLNSSSQNSKTQNDYVNDNNILNTIYEQNRKKIQASNDALNDIYQGDFKSAAFSYASAGMATEAYVSYGIDFASDIIGALKVDQVQKLRNYAEDVSNMMPEYLKKNQEFFDIIPSDLALRNTEYEDWITLDKELRNKEVELLDKINFLNRKTDNKFTSANDKIQEFLQVRLALILEFNSRMLFSHIIQKGLKDVDIFDLKEEFYKTETEYLRLYAEKNGDIGPLRSGFWTHPKRLSNKIANILQNEFNSRDLALIHKNTFNSFFNDYGWKAIIYLRSELEFEGQELNELKNYLKNANLEIKKSMLHLAFHRPYNFGIEPNSGYKSEDKIIFLLKDCEYNFFLPIDYDYNKSEQFPFWKAVNRKRNAYGRLVFKETDRFVDREISKLKSATGLSRKKLTRKGSNCHTPSCE